LIKIKLQFFERFLMSSLAELLKQQAELSAKIEAVRGAERDKAIESAKAIVSEYGLTASDIFGSGKAKTKPAKGERAKVAPKYKDTATGATWSGRGIAPKWLEGHDRAKFLIK
jgi:DNA-binding protein H-NS